MNAVTPNERILVVEDNNMWPKRLALILERLGERRQVEICDIDSFAAKFKTSADFEGVSICIVDLELSGDGGTVANDVKGMTEILPRVRALAPWMPIACISRYVEADKSIVADLSVTDFDLFAAKSLIGSESRTHAEFNADMWRNMLLSMQTKRVAWLTGRSPGEVSSCLANKPELTLDDRTKQAVENLGVTRDSFRRGLCVLGLGASEIAVEALEPGFSGLQVSRVRAMGHSEQEAISAHWLVKWGRPISKLSHEAIAHRRHFLHGLNRAVQIPQFHPNAIVWDGIGYLAYAFERDTETALSVAMREGLGSLRTAIEEVCEALYSSARKKAVVGREQVVSWTAPSNSDDATGAFGLDAGIQEVSWSLIHGDMHLRNIFIRTGRPTLIDFARSAPGPIAIDAAKLVIDTLAFVPQANSDSLASFSVSGLESSELAPVFEPFEDHLKASGDAALLSAALNAFSQRYLAYPDVSDRAKTALRRLIQC